MSDFVDPGQFVITRRRKKYKFAKFHNAENCFELDEWKKRSVDVVEIGAGTGMFSVEMAILHPEQIFVAIDIKADRLQKGAYMALERGLKNVFFVRVRADQLTELFEPRSLKAIWITFPDPYPKKRAAGRRLTHPTFLNLYAKLLTKGGSMYLKHDNEQFFDWSLEQLVKSKWSIGELSFDLHESDLNDDYKIQTDYEKRWLEDSRVIKFCNASQN